MGDLYSILELPLILEEGQKNVIDKKIDCAKRIYNNMLSDNLKKYKEMIKTKEWRGLNDIIREELSGAAKKSDRLKGAYARKNEIMRANGFSDFGFRSQVLEYSKYYQKHIPAIVARLSVGMPMWSAFEKLFFENGDMVHFKKFDDTMSLCSDNKSGIRFLQEESGRYYVFLSNRSAKAKEAKIYVKESLNMYEREMLFQAKIKKVCILKRLEKSKRSYYVQLTLRRAPFEKLDKEGNPLHPVREDRVGIAIWRGQLCAVSSKETYTVDLTPDAEEFEQRKQTLSRELQHLREVNNQQNYNEDGAIKNGIVDKNGKRCRLHWNESNHYKGVKQELRELHRVHAEQKDLHQRKIVWKLLSMGNEFYLADTSFITKKPEWDEEEPLPNSEYKKKKERRKSIPEAAPAALLTKLDLKLQGYGYEPVHRYKIPERLYWYHHEKGVSEEQFFPGEDILVNGKVINQTLYRALLIRHYEEAKGYDQNGIEENWKAVSGLY